MSRLIVESGNEEGMVFPLGEEAVTVGRSATATIQIVDKRVSRHHITLRKNRDSFQVEDLGSKNGTLLNSEPLVGMLKLKSGDRIQLGDTVLVFEREPGEAESDLSDTPKSSGSVRLVPGDVGARQESFPVDSRRLFEIDDVGPEILSDPFERLKVLYQVADSIRTELRLDDLLEKIMDIAWKVVNPYRGVILLRDERDGSLDPVVVRSRGSAKDEITISSTVVERCIDERVSILVSDAPSDVRFSGNESIIAGRIRSVICAPIVWQNDVLGVIYIDSQEPGTVYYTNDELELISGIANQAAMAITNARLHSQAVDRQKLEKELEIARSIQMNLLPKTYPEIEGMTLSAMSIPARKVGGDYYDFVPLEDGRTAIVIADVSGKGVPAAILTATIRASIRVESHQPGVPTVDKIVSAINRWTCRDATNNMFVTMVYGVYDPVKRVLEYTNAGHSFPLIFKTNGDYIQLDTGGCFLGIMDEVEYERAFVQLEPGDVMIMYTDGVTDAHNAAGQIYGFDRMIKTIKDNLHLPPEELRDAIYEGTLDFRGNADQFDDLSLIVAKL